MNTPIFYLIVFLFFACTPDNEKIKKTDETNETSTPDALNESKSDYSIGSISKRYDADVIQKLYEEAMEKNNKLESLNNSINIVGQIKSDSLEVYDKYIRTNTAYWRAVEHYIGLINDSTLKGETAKLFKTLEIKYYHRISKHDSILHKLESRTNELQDKLILMKLMVASEMMYNYQQNELPKLKPLSTMVFKYDSLIKATTVYTKFKK